MRCLLCAVFSEYHPYVDLSGAQLKVVPADTENFQINFECFARMLTQKVMAVLINTPNNPSGTVYTKETLEKLAQIMTKKAQEYGHEIYLISDEPYREILFAGVEEVYVSRFYANTISCYSYSKSLSIPGERIGYIAINPACEDAVTMINMCGQISRGIGHNCPTSIIQLAVAEVACETSDLSVYETNMNILYEELVKLGFTCVKPGGTLYIPESAGRGCEDILPESEKLRPYSGAGRQFRMSGIFPYGVLHRHGESRTVTACFEEIRGDGIWFEEFVRFF